VRATQNLDFRVKTKSQSLREKSDRFDLHSLRELIADGDIADGQVVWTLMLRTFVKLLVDHDKWLVV